MVGGSNPSTGSTLYRKQMNTVEVVIRDVLNKYSEDTIRRMVDELIPEYLSSDWEEDFNDEYDAYIETGNVEAEAAILTQVINENLRATSTELSTDEWCVVYDELKEEWGI